MGGSGLITRSAGLNNMFLKRKGEKIVFKKTWLMISIFVILSVISACSTSKEGEKEKSDELTYATVKDINDMNPHLYPGSMSAQGMVYESLVENTEDGIKPLLAKSWDISEDGKVYTFHLREDVKFHDGEPFNADAVKKNFDAVQKNKEKHSWIKLSTKIVNVEATDEYTVKLTLSEAYYPTLEELSMTRPYVFLSPKDFKDGGTKDGVKGFHGTGPYKLTEHKVDQYAIFKANKDYWAGAPKIKKITAKVLPAGETTLLALQKGEVNFTFTDDWGTDSINVEGMEQLAKTGDYQVVRSNPMNTSMIVANSGKKDSPVHERSVREAIWHAIDRETISRDIFSGTVKAADTLFASNVPYANVELKKRDYDVNKAKEILEEAGWKNSEKGTAMKKEGKPLTMKLYYDSTSPSQKAQGELIQDSLKKIGMNLELVGEESSSIANRRTTGDYDLLFNQTWGLAYDPQSTISAFTSESSYLHATEGIPNAEQLYQKIEDVLTSTDEDSRKTLYKDILTTVHEEAIFIPITNGNVTVIAPKSLKGISFEQTQYELPFEKMYFE